MRLVLRILGIGLGVVAIVSVLVAIVSRSSDGPIGIFAGGPLVAGELVSDGDIDWSFAEAVDTVEFQLENPPRSRTTWILVHENSAFIPCGLTSFSLWKQWPHEAMRDGRSIVRIGDKRYSRHAVRVMNPELLAALGSRAQAKYGLPDAMISEEADVWYFRLDPPRD